MTKKKKSNKIPLPIFILICAVLLFAMYISLSTLTLAIWGESVMGTVDSYDSRLEDMRAQENRSRTISKGYWFMANGKEYRGYVMYSSDEAWPNLDEGETRSERISYLSFLPYINKPSALCEFSSMGEGAIIYHILAPIGCALLLLLVTRTQKKQTKQKKKAARKPAAPQIIEARSDTDIFCPNCGTKLPKDAEFCFNCGTKLLPAAASGVMISAQIKGGSLMKQFDRLLKAAEYAATIATGWRFANSDDTYTKAALLTLAETSDDEDPIDEDGFSVVSPGGAIGICRDKEEGDIDWLFLPNPDIGENLPDVYEAASQNKFCSKCGRPVTPGARFCDECGAQLE